MSASSFPTSSHLERVTRIAAELFEVELALLVLADGRTVARTARADAALAETLAAACAQALTQADRGPAFHAAAALVGARGERLGTLCLADSGARGFGTREQARLDDLAALAAPHCAPPVPQAAALDGCPLAVLDALADGLLLLDEDRNLLWANRAAAALVGADGAALAGRRAQDFVVEAVPGLVDDLAAGDVAIRRMTGRRPGGATVALQVAASRFEQDGRTRYVALVRDAAGESEQMWRARAAGERRHKTFSLASHELRTPLASILGFSELLLKRDFDAATARELIEIVHAQAGLMSTLVNQVLDLARIEAGGRQALRIAPTAIDTVLVQALASVEPLGQNARITLDIGNGLAPVAADPHRLQMAFSNVLSNSIRYSSAPSPIAVRAWSEPGARTLLVRIADGGVGMSMEERERLFEPFFRGAAGHGGGSGLGMAIFKEIVDLHNGSVEVESSPGAGTAITVRLPLAAQAHDD